MPTTDDKTDTELNLRQKAFCELFSSDREFFGNGVMSYAEAYSIDLSKKGAYKTAQVNASRLLSNAIVLAEIDRLLELHGLNDSFVDKQLEFLITQSADYSAKLGSIREYNKLKKRVADRLEHTGKDGDPIESSMSITYMPEPYPDDFYKPASHPANDNSQ